jgi:hypothetical protein
VSPLAEDGSVEHTRTLFLDKLCSYWELPADITHNVSDKECSRVFYHLHPEFVERRQDDQGLSSFWVILCRNCICSLEKKEIPLLSVANVDFGLSERLGLPILNCFERQVVSLVRHYHTVIKIERKNDFGQMTSVPREHLQNAVASHAILFRHDAPVKVASASLLRRDLILSGEFHLQFVGPEREVDLMMNQVFSGQRKVARWHIIYCWLAVLCEVNHHYSEIDLPAYSEVKEIVSQWIRDLENAASRCTAAIDQDHNAMTGNDTANVRETGDHCIGCNEEALIGIRHSCVMERDAGGRNDSGASTTGVIQASSRSLGRRCEDEILESIREKEPIDEFTNNEEGLVKAFPDVFILGCGYGRDAGALSRRERLHLLLQHSAAAATSPALLFYLFDQEQRHSTISGMSCKVKSDRDAFRVFAELILSDDFQARLQNALHYSEKGNEYSSTKGRRENDLARQDRSWVLRQIMPVLNFAGKRTLFGAVERNNSVSRILALARRYGPASVFLTIAVDDVNDPLGFRLACRSKDNVSFPSVSDDEFGQALRQGSIHQKTNVSCSYGSRVERAVSNPVAVAVQYRSMIENILTVLVGCPPNLSQTGSKTVKTEYYGALRKRFRHLEEAGTAFDMRPRKGIFGTPVS